MAALIVVVAFVVVIAALDMASTVWGVDSRDQFPDDYRR